MNTEFTTELKESGTLRIPREVAKNLPCSGTPRIIFLSNITIMETLPEVVDALPLGGFRLRIHFAGGEQGDVDLSHYLAYGPIFEPLANESFFRNFVIEGGTIAWPNGADIAPERLYELVSRKGLTPCR